MNYTIKDANKIRVGDTLTLEDETVREAVKDKIKDINYCLLCSLCGRGHCCAVFCASNSFHFKQINP